MRLWLTGSFHQMGGEIAPLALRFTLEERVDIVVLWNVNESRDFIDLWPKQECIIIRVLASHSVEHPPLTATSGEYRGAPRANHSRQEWRA